MIWFPLGLACGLLFVVLYDRALQRWRSSTITKIEGLETKLNSYYDAEMARCAQIERWRQECLAQCKALTIILDEYKMPQSAQRWREFAAAGEALAAHEKPPESITS